MTEFDDGYFQNFDFSPEQIKKYWESAIKDLNIARRAEEPEVKFQFAYNAFIKLGITLIAESGMRAKSRMGHHLKIIEKMSEILKDKDILAIGNQIRKARNTELYGGGIVMSKKQADDYLDFVMSASKKAREIIKKQLNPLF